MNIIEAVKSGKPFKRKCYTSHHWITVEISYVCGEEVKTFEFSEKMASPASIEPEDVMAEDWEVKDEP